ncbi:hypothetical protein PF010_g32322, partial [Phytophthora fragariae]
QVHEESVCAACESEGYRHIDTAVYRNEADVVEGVRLSNRKLGLEYIDLYLLHAPFDAATRADAWKAFEDMQTEGVVRDIRVPNFGELHLQKLAQTWRVKPAVNQGILMEAYSPLARAQKMHDRTLKQVASEAGATSAQVLIAWSLANGENIDRRS